MPVYFSAKLRTSYIFSEELFSLFYELFVYILVKMPLYMFTIDLVLFVKRCNVTQAQGYYNNLFLVEF